MIGRTFVSKVMSLLFNILSGFLKLSSKKQKNSRKTSAFALLTAPKPFPVWTTKNWKILQATGIPDHPNGLQRNLYAGQEATVRTGQGTTDCFQIRKEIRQGFILSPCLFNFYAEYIMGNAGLDEAQAGIKSWEKHQ